MSAKIDPKPAQKPALSPNEPRFWDARDLEGELRRVFEICHSCRMCVNYCGSFPDLFARVDRDIEARGAEGAELLGAADFRSVTDLCWQCKLCYIKCPYTPDEAHAWEVDFPRLLMREKAVRAQREGIATEDLVLGEPQLVGRLGAGPQAPLANLVNAARLTRKVAAKALGISEEFPLPAFARTSFPAWFAAHAPLPGAGERGTVAIFATCTGDWNAPAMPANAVRVLEANGWAVVRPEQTCCGMPNIDGGDIDAARAKAKANVAALVAEVDKGRSIVVPGPTCSYVMKKEWPELLETDEARRVAAATFDLMEFLDKLRRDKTLKREFTKGLGKVAYHAACHLRAQKIGVPGARVLGLLPDTEVEVVEQCSAVDGTWGMKERFYETGRKYAQRLVRGVADAQASVVVTDCKLAGLRVEKENGVRVLHPVEALAECYGVEVQP